MPAAILLPAALVFLRAHWLFLALCDDGDAVGRNPEVDEIVLHRSRATRTEGEVVFGAPARIAVALDRDLRARPALHPVGVALEHRTGVVANRRLVEVEEDLSQRLLGVQLLERLIREESGPRSTAPEAARLAAVVAAVAEGVAVALQQVAAAVAALELAQALSCGSRQVRWPNSAQQPLLSVRKRIIVTLLVESRSLQSDCSSVNS